MGMSSQADQEGATCPTLESSPFGPLRLYYSLSPSVRVRNSVMEMVQALSPAWSMVAGTFEFEYDHYTDTLWLVGASRIEAERLSSASDSEVTSFSALHGSGVRQQPPQLQHPWEGSRAPDHTDEKGTWALRILSSSQCLQQRRTGMSLVVQRRSTSGYYHERLSSAL